MRRYVPKTIPAPLARYVHAVEVPPNQRLLLVSGQVGIEPDGSISPDAEAQADRAFANVAAILADAGMTASNVVHLTGYVTDRAHLDPYRRARDRFVGAHVPPASTLLVVAGLAHEDTDVEVEVIAADRDPML